MAGEAKTRRHDARFAPVACPDRKLSLFFAACIADAWHRLAMTCVCDRGGVGERLLTRRYDWIERDAWRHITIRQYQTWGSQTLAISAVYGVHRSPLGQSMGSQGASVGTTDLDYATVEYVPR